MIFERVDDSEPERNIPRVTYRLSDTVESFSITATRYGVVASGTTPEYTDATQINAAFVRAWYQFGSLRDRGKPLSLAEEAGARLC